MGEIYAVESRRDDKDVTGSGEGKKKKTKRDQRCDPFFFFLWSMKD